MKEQVVSFGQRASLTGILTEPRDPAPGRPAMILLNAGIIHRVGVNRVYVRIARRLARQGVSVLRFDLAGIGDSGYRDDDSSFVVGAISDTQQAMEVLGSLTDANRIVLAGICSGAVIAFRAALQSEQVSASILINPMGQFHGDEDDVPTDLLEQVQTRCSHRLELRSSFSVGLWKRRAGQPANLLRGLRQIRISMIREVVWGGSNGAQPFPGAVEEVESLLDRGVGVYMIHAEADAGLDYSCLALGDELAKLQSRSGFDFEVIRGANHVFTRLWSQNRLVEMIADWMATRPFEEEPA